VLYMSGLYAKREVAHQGVLDPNVEYLPQPFTPTQGWRRKVHEVLHPLLIRPAVTVAMQFVGQCLILQLCLHWPFCPSAALYMILALGQSNCLLIASFHGEDYNRQPGIRLAVSY